MAVKFKVVKKKNPADKKDPGKYYAQATVSGEVTLDTLARRIAKGTMAARGDVLGVVTSLVDEVIESLEEGNTVCLGELGRVRVGLSSEGSDEANKVTANNVRKGHIIYVPSVMLKDRIARISFRGTTATQPEAGTGEEEKPTETPDMGGGSDYE